MSSGEKQPVIDKLGLGPSFEDPNIRDLAEIDGLVAPEYIEDLTEADSPFEEASRAQYAVISEGHGLLDDFMAAPDGHGIKSTYEKVVHLQHKRDKARKSAVEVESSADNSSVQEPGIKDKVVLKLGRIIPRRIKGDAAAGVGTEFNAIPVEVSPTHLIEGQEATIEEAATKDN